MQPKTEKITVKSLDGNNAEFNGIYRGNLC